MARITHDHAVAHRGLVPTAQLGSGTASSTTFLRGDQSWATPAGGSDPTYWVASHCIVMAEGDTLHLSEMLTPAGDLATYVVLEFIRLAGPSGFVQSVLIAESNSPASATTSETDIAFDTFYDVTQTEVESFPTDIGLTYDSGVFTASEDGIWMVNVGAYISAAAGSVGRLLLHLPNYGLWPQVLIGTQDATE